MTDAEVCEMFAEADLNKDGRVDYDEFTRMMTCDEVPWEREDHPWYTGKK